MLRPWQDPRAVLLSAKDDLIFPVTLVGITPLFLNEHTVGSLVSFSVSYWIRPVFVCYYFEEAYRELLSQLIIANDKEAKILF